MHFSYQLLKCSTVQEEAFTACATKFKDGVMFLLKFKLGKTGIGSKLFLITSSKRRI